MSPIRVAIISAGPISLTLARLLPLNKPNVDFVVFESEKSRDARGQGGTLDLHPATGLAALKEAGLYDEFLERARFDGEELIICDKDLTKYVELSGSDENSSHGTPEIYRISLGEMLVDCSFQ
jgi:2-polyprenyl-6-methoxyphenol hydroxylase-like FAD-dependent oxidoreductase